MGLFGKVLPWKRKDDLALNENIGMGPYGQPGPFEQQLDQTPYPSPALSGFPQRPSMDAFQQNQSYAAGKEIEVVSAKLDAVKAALESLNQRLANIERYMQAEQEFKKRGGW